MNYPELVEAYRNFINCGGRRSGSKLDAEILRDMEQEIAARERCGDTVGLATLNLGGNSVEVYTVPEKLLQSHRK